MRSYEILGIPKNSLGNPRKPEEIIRNPSNSKEFPPMPRTSQKYLSFPMGSLDILGFPRIPLAYEIPGTSIIFQEFLGNPEDFLRNPRKSLEILRIHKES